jgi:hypothetical protein
MGGESSGQLKFVCLRDEKVLRLHMYTGGGTLMSSLESADPATLKAMTAAWLRSRGLTFQESELEAAIGRAASEPPP